MNIDVNTPVHRYDAVFHLVTAADGAEEFYSLTNNKARSEGLAAAIEVFLTSIFFTVSI